MQEEAAAFGVEISWSKTKIQAVGLNTTRMLYMSLAMNWRLLHIYLAVHISNDGSSD